MGDERWDSAARAELVLKILEGQTTVAEAAALHELEPAVVEQWKQDFLLGGQRAMAQAKRPPAGKASSRAGTVAVVIGGIVAALLFIGGAGVIGAWWLLRERPSAAQRECHTAVASLLQGLRAPVTVTLYTTGGLEALESATDKVDRLLTQWQKQSNGKLIYRHVRVESEEDRRRAEEAGLQPTAFGAAAGDKATLSQGFFGLIIEYRSEKGTIPQLVPEGLSGIEFWIANKIREVRAKADQEQIGVSELEGAGQIGLGDPNLVPRTGVGGSPNIRGILAQAFPFYSIRNVPAGKGLDSLGAQRVLLVTQPQRDLTDEELRLIDAFLMLGNRTVVFWVGAVNLQPGDHTMRAELSRRRVDELLVRYGIELRKDLVTDPEGALDLRAPGAIGAVSFAFPAITIVTNVEGASGAKPGLDDDFPPFFHLPELALPLASSLVLHPEQQPGAELRPVARSSAAATVIEDAAIPLLERKVGPGPAATRVLAAALSGKIKSAYGDREAPGRVLVVASSLFVTNPFVRAGNAVPTNGQFAGLGVGDPRLQGLGSAYAQRFLTSTILSVKNTLDWGSSDDGIIACAALLVRQAESKPGP